MPISRKHDATFWYLSEAIMVISRLKPGFNSCCVHRTDEGSEAGETGRCLPWKQVTISEFYEDQIDELVRAYPKSSFVHSVSFQ